ncbi:MAG: hypothetical protein AAF718_16720 [Pseudomonadota bacterium]
MHLTIKAATLVVSASLLSVGQAHAEDDVPAIQFAGTLEFSETGTLFVGDNYTGSIYAFDLTDGTAPDAVLPVNVGEIDVKLADVLGVPPSAVAINDMATHPVTAEVYISVSRISNFGSAPALLKITQASEIKLVDMDGLDFERQALVNYPDQETTFRPRGLMGNPPTARELANAENTLSSLAIMDIEYFDGEVFVSGVAFDNFLSTLRRMPFPFDGAQSITSVEMYHIAHERYETRAPIRAMAVKEIDGKLQLVASYTCSPIVLISLDEIVDGADISARTILDYGSGQPLDMVSYSVGGQEMLFVTNNSRSPQVIPFAGLNGAQALTPEDIPEGATGDMSSLLPIGPSGKAVMFDGMSLHIDNLGDRLFVSMTRDLYTGRLNLDSNANFFPNRLHNLVAEFDFPQYDPETVKR